MDAAGTMRAMTEPLVTLEARRAGATVLVVTNIWPHEADPTYGIFVKRQVDSLVERGLCCDVVFIRGYLSGRAYAAAARHLLAAGVRGRRYALVHAHGGEAGVVAGFYARAPVVVTYYGSDLLGIWRRSRSLPLTSRVRRRLVRDSARLAAATITQSRQMESVLPQRVRARNRVVPNGIDRRVFHPLDRARVRAELGWSDSEPVCLFAGNPSLPVKRFALAEAACRRAERETGPIRLAAIWGTAPERMPAVLNAADCLLLTSSSEGSPNVVKEAVTCGLPVITTQVGDVDDLLRDVEPSWICGDASDELSSAVVDCLSRRTRSNGWVAGEWFSLESVAARIEQLYGVLAPELVAA